HDRYFLDRVTNRTMELEHGHVKLFKGNYTACQQFKKQEREVRRKHYENSMREMKRIEGIIAQQRQWNREKNIRTAESKEKMLERMKAELEIPDSELDRLHFSFQPRIVSGNDVILASGLTKSFEEKKLFANVELHVRRGDRAFLLGPNGCGKTTLLRVLLGKTPADSGRFTFGTNVQIGYFDQGLAGLHPAKTVLDEIWDTYPAMTQPQVRSALAAFLFQGEDVYKRVQTLSGGEKARTALLKLMLSGANLLLLDEPTNHLDISSREALEDALSGYEGTMLIVSHDRYFINKLANRVLHLTHDGVKEYLGGYDDYVQALDNQPRPGKVAAEKPKQNDYKLRKERESERRKLMGRISRCEQEIAAIDEETAALNAQLEQPQVAADYAKVLELTQQLAALHEKQEALYAEWEKMQETLEAEE
uniref:ABC-F family ATP-binding cassette domain-containing protein n=1 Tax=Candidatus Fimivicinus sp. TaxID=3056640 RepID=UPI003FEEC197